MNHWHGQVSAMANNIKQYVREAKRDGITGMSLANLSQVVPTRGIDVHPTAFSRLIQDAIRSAGLQSFITG
jgi:hypothetical protein